MVRRKHKAKVEQKKSPELLESSESSEETVEGQAEALFGFTGTANGTVVVVPDINFAEPTGDPLVNMRRAFGPKPIGATGPAASVSSVSRRDAEKKTAAEEQARA
jgi:hypothetical protein